MKLLLLMPDLTEGGAQKVLVNLLKHFDRSRVDLIFVAANLIGPIVKELPEDIEVINLEVKRVRNVIPKLLKTIRTIKPDVIMSMFERMNFALLLLRPFIPKKTQIVIREVNLPTKTMYHLTSSKKRIYKMMYSWLYPKANRIIAQSDIMRTEIIKVAGVNENKVVTIHNPVDIKGVNQQAGHINPFDRSLDHNIVAVGRLEYQKGFDILIHAFKLLSERLPNANLYLLGSGRLLHELRQQAIDLGIEHQVHFLGYIENPYPYIKYADIFVLSSRFEGFPNVLLEALSCGVKIISVDCESGPRDILSKLEYGVLVESQNADKLAEGLFRGLNDDTIGRNGYSRALDFDSDKITRQYEKVLLG